MLSEILEVRPLDGHRLFLRFDDGAEGMIDVDDFLQFDGVFAALADHAMFATVRVDIEAGTVVWPNGADLCPDVLHARLTGAALPGADAAARAS